MTLMDRWEALHWRTRRRLRPSYWLDKAYYALAIPLGYARP